MSFSETNWMQEAACLNAPDPDIFFPEKGEKADRDRARAREMCASCSVRNYCLNLALQNNEEYGVWGGESQKELKRIRQERVVAPTPIRRSLYPLGNRW